MCVLEQVTALSDPCPPPPTPPEPPIQQESNVVSDVLPWLVSCPTTCAAKCLCVRPPFNAELFTRAAIERCAFFQGAAVASLRRRHRRGNKRQTSSWAVPNRCFYQLDSGAVLLAQANAQTRVLCWKWTTLVRLEVSGDNAVKQRPPFSINTISMQEMSLKSVLDAMSAVLCSNKHISRDVFYCSCTFCPVIGAAFTAWASLLIKYATVSLRLRVVLCAAHELRYKRLKLFIYSSPPTSTTRSNKS